ncbi:LysR family transcriptional regulator [Ferrimonas aestuarii]|uniref:LysR family transcriptional regulator n=1 Tax=Ferrimonas aestuarii TaxID=2569539 RepID=A0A4U1BLU1_9GAMM|nr:LysR family transcriptional regulator [Ferrimonas aestuarii]TKB53916.1 LysR family transcriptional regulator [Ferrimonas aestuarii]
MYTLEQLRMFVAAAECGSFSAAARKLSKAQSVVSQGIINLEIDFGQELFDRSSRSPTLTTQGKVLLEHAQGVLTQHQRMETVMHSLAKGEEVKLVLAVDEALMTPKFNQVLHQFSEQFQATNLEFLSAASPDVPNLVHSGQADLGLMFSQMPMPELVDATFIGHLPFVAVAAPGHPLTKIDDAITLEQLRPHRQLLIKGVGGDSLAHIEPLSPNVWWCNNLYAMRDMAANGFGWCYLPKHLIDYAYYTDNIEEISLAIDHQTWMAPVDKLMRPNANPGPALSWLSHALNGILAAAN